MARVVRAAGADPVVGIVNCSDIYKLLKKDKEISLATPIKDFLSEDEDEVITPPTKANVCEVSEANGTDKTDKTTVPPHLKVTFENCKQHLSPEEQIRLAELLTENQNVFAKHEFDLCNFTAIEHGIDMQNAAPIKQRLRRTPACFVGEEEAHLKKMLDAGVIQETVSDWASSPVLIRKCDGTVRCCIDYRSLDNVTVKDVFPLPLVDDCLDTIAGNVWFFQT